MKKNSINIIIVAFAVMLVCSCHTGGRYSFDEIKYVETFDDEVQIPASRGERIDLGVVGIQGFKIYGPYLLVSSNSEEGQITILDKKPPYQKFGSFFKKGNGPGELVYPLSPSSFVYHTSDDGDIYAEVNSRTGKILRFDISRSIEEGRTVSEVIGSAGKTAFEVINLGEDGIFYKEMSPEQNTQVRYIEKDGQRIITKGMETLNAACIKHKIDDGDRFNALSGSVKYDPESKLFFETPGQINAIHVYSLDDSVAKTICFGNKLYDYNEVADLPEAEKPNTNICTRLYESQFLVTLYLDITKLEYFKGEWKPSLIIYDWLDGDSLTKVGLPDKVNVFDFDFETMSLYAYDSDSELFYVYDVSGI